MRPTTLAECDALVEWAQETNTGPIRATPEQIVNRLELLKSALPSQNQDFESGAMRAAVLVSLLCDYSDAAIEHMVNAAIRTLDWFPTPKQCLELVATYRAPPTEQDQALLICREFAEEQFAQWLENLRNGQPIGDVPERWMRIAVERGAMRVLADGRFVSRALYHGPVRPISAVARVPVDVVEGCGLRASDYPVEDAA